MLITHIYIQINNATFINFSGGGGAGVGTRTPRDIRRTAVQDLSADERVSTGYIDLIFTRRH